MWIVENHRVAGASRGEGTHEVIHSIVLGGVERNHLVGDDWVNSKFDRSPYLCVDVPTLDEINRVDFIGYQHHVARGCGILNG